MRRSCHRRELTGEVAGSESPCGYYVNINEGPGARLPCPAGWPRWPALAGFYFWVSRREELKKLFAVLGLGIVFALMTGCASVPMANVQQDAAAKTFKHTEGKANLYVYRNESLGAALKLPVIVDGKVVGDTAANTFMLLTLEPGKHTVLSKSKDDVLELDLQAGKNYFVWQEIKMGAFSGGTKLQQVSDAVGQKAVAECKLIGAAK